MTAPIDPVVLAQIKAMEDQALASMRRELDRAFFAPNPIYARYAPPPPPPWYVRVARTVRWYGWNLGQAFLAVGRACVGRPAWPEEEAWDD